MKSDFFKVVLVVSLALGPAKAMMEDEEPSKHTQCKLLQKKPSKTNSPLSSEVPIESLGDELLLAIFGFVKIPDLGKLSQVSTRWNTVTETPSLWKFMGAKYYDDFLSPNDLTQNPKQQVIYHYLSVIVNHTENLKEIDRLVSSYQLHLYVLPFKKAYLGRFYPESFLEILTDGVEDLLSREELIMQGNEYYIQKKLNGLCGGSDGYTEDLEAAREFNESLVEKGDPRAIKRKIKALTEGKKGYKTFVGEEKGYGYTEDWEAAREFNESLVEKGDPEAIERKIEALVKGGYGYTEDWEAAREFNESLVEKGDAKAIKRKIDGLTRGGTMQNYGYDPSDAMSRFYAQLYPKTYKYHGYGYESNPQAIKELLDLLAEKGDPEALETKIWSLAWGKNGYEKDKEAARRLNEFFVEKGDLEAIERKIKGLEVGQYGYTEDLEAARRLEESLVEKGDTKAIKRKISSLERGDKKDKEAARRLEESLAEKGDPEALESLRQRVCQKEVERTSFGVTTVFDNALHKSFNELFVEKGNLMAIVKKIKGLGIGAMGYEKNPLLAREFIEGLVINKNPIARGIGKYIKAFAMKYGISKLGYEKDREKAFKFIRENCVPY